jgi:predicted ester cyclase
MVGRMDEHSNKAIVHRLYANEGVQRGLQTVDEVTSPELEAHGLFPGAPPGIAGVRAGLAMLLEAFPDARFAVERTVAEGDSVAARVRLTGTHRGPLLGMPPTGRAVDLVEHIFFRFAGGKVVESWSVRDDLGLMRQLGQVPG